MLEVVGIMLGMKKRLFCTMGLGQEGIWTKGIKMVLLWDRPPLLLFIIMIEGAWPAENEEV